MNDIDVAPRASEAQQLMVTQMEGLLSQLELIDNEIGTLVRRKKEIAGQIVRYQQRIEEGPKIELLFVDLRRDYSQASANYQSLLQRKSQAQLAENLEKTHQAEQFSVLDPAILPQKPFKPNSRKVLALGFMMALALRMCGNTWTRLFGAARSWKVWSSFLCWFQFRLSVQSVNAA